MCIVLCRDHPTNPIDAVNLLLTIHHKLEACAIAIQAERV